MIVSHEYSFIFLKTLKTGGHAIESALAPQLGAGDVLTPQNRPARPQSRGGKRDLADPALAPRNHRGRFNPLPLLFAAPKGRRRQAFSKYLRAQRFYPHMAAFEVRNRLPAKLWHGYFKFCVERNPWDRLVATYQDRKSAGTLPGRVSFAEFVQRHMMRSNWDLYTIKDRLAVDRVVRYESLSAELPDIFRHLGLQAADASACDPDRAPTDYRAYYNAELRDQVAVRYSREIAMFGYSF